jgi:hypothetical protein
MINQISTCNITSKRHFLFIELKEHVSSVQCQIRLQDASFSPQKSLGGEASRSPGYLDVRFVEGKVVVM